MLGLGKLFGGISSGVTSVSGSLSKFRLDLASRDDAQVAAHVMIGIGYAEDGLDDSEIEMTVTCLESIFPNFKRDQISGFVSEAVTAYKVPALGRITTKRLIQSFNETDGSFEKIMASAVAVASADGNIGDKEKATIIDFLKAKPGITPAQIGL